MKAKISQWLTIILALGFLCMTAYAQNLVADRDYAVIEPAFATGNPDKIEVIEFFSYACNHCNDLHPLSTAWSRNLPKDVVFKRIPVGGSHFYTMMARTFYALEALGELGRLDSTIFGALHGRRQAFNSENSMIRWLASQGVNESQFRELFSSFAIDSKVRRGDQLASMARVRGVPSLVVDGRYLILAKEARTFADLLALTDRVIEKRRTGRRKTVDDSTAATPRAT